MIPGSLSCWPPPRRRLLAALLALLVGAFAAFGSRADEDESEEVIHHAIEAGEIVPLAQLLGRIRRDFNGRILKVELEREGHDEHLWVYEAKILTPKGQVLELEYNAKSLELIEIEGRQDDDD